MKFEEPIPTYPLAVETLVRGGIPRNVAEAAVAGVEYGVFFYNIPSLQPFICPWCLKFHYSLEHRHLAASWKMCDLLFGEDCREFRPKKSEGVK